jgi:hypothetical protein
LCILVLEPVHFFIAVMWSLFWDAIFTSINCHFCLYAQIVFGKLSLPVSITAHAMLCEVFWGKVSSLFDIVPFWTLLATRYWDKNISKGKEIELIIQLCIFTKLLQMYALSEGGLDEATLYAAFPFVSLLIIYTKYNPENRLVWHF